LHFRYGSGELRQLALYGKACRRYNREAMTASLPIQANYSLQTHNTFGIAAKTRAYLPVTDVSTLHALHASGTLAEMPFFVLGGGSNILLTTDFPGLVLHMRNTGITIDREDEQAVYVRAAAGENWHAFVLWSLQRGLGGLENLSLIPGTVGASPIQNIGAYGAEVKDTLHSVTVFDLEKGELRTLDKADCEFAYRDSIFKRGLRGKVVIVDVCFALPKRWQPNIRYAELSQELAARGVSDPDPRTISDAVIAIRSRKLPDPAAIGNAGSFFKNPVVSADQRTALLERYPQLVSYPQPDGGYKLAAGWLIDQCGWKGRGVGAAGVYEKQALVLVNRGGAQGKDVLALADAIQSEVNERFGVRLEPEPVFI
jgi:UDP-N-acetylmuramate dehydrogenase